MKAYKLKIIFSSDIKLRFIVIFPLILILLFLLISSFFTPYFETRLMTNYYEFFNGILGKICHQYPSRCLYVFGSNMGLCARCFSIYLSILISSVFYLFLDINLKGYSRLIMASILITPLIVDGITQHLHLQTSTNFVRVITGLMAGLGISNILVPYYIRITINFFNRLKNINCRKEGKIWEGWPIRL